MYSVQIAVSDGTLTRIALSIEYFEKDDITLFRNLNTTPLVLGTDWQWDGDTRINLLTGVPVPNGEYITVRRNTNIDRAYNIYDGGAAFSRDTLDENFKQMIYLAQEFTEGNGLTGVFFPLNMHGFKITNLGPGTDPTDAVNKAQLDVVEDRVTNLEDTFIGTTSSYPWYEVTTEIKDTFSPPFQFTKAAVFLNGVAQTPDYSYIVVDNSILLADAVPVHTMFFARLGEDAGTDVTYATTDQLSYAIATVEAEHAEMEDHILTKSNKGANVDITSLHGLTTPLSVDQGGTSATTLTEFKGDLGVDRFLQGSTYTNIYTANGTHTLFVNNTGQWGASNGVTRIPLSISYGGTGGTDITSARANLTVDRLQQNTAETLLYGKDSTVALSIGGDTPLRIWGVYDYSAGAWSPLGIAQGGTGATTNTGALQALGAAGRGANTDINSLQQLNAGITGIKSGIDAGPGIVGEAVRATTNSTTILSATNTNVLVMVLPAGDWDIACGLSITNGGVVTAQEFGVSETSSTMPPEMDRRFSTTANLAAGTNVSPGPSFVILSNNPKTLYLVANVTFGGSCSAAGYIKARRIR